MTLSLLLLCYQHLLVVVYSITSTSLAPLYYPHTWNCGFAIHKNLCIVLCGCQLTLVGVRQPSTCTIFLPGRNVTKIYSTTSRHYSQEQE